MSLLDKLIDIPENYIYLILAVILIVSTFVPIGLPVPITDQTRKYFNDIEALPPGSVILVPFDPSPGTEMEIGLSSHIVMKHLFRKDFILVFVSISLPAPPLFESTLKDENLWDKYQQYYGTRYVWLGYISGAETAAAALSSSITKTLLVDYYGNNLKDMPIFQNIEGAKDFDVVVCVNSQATLSVSWMNQWAVPYKLPLYVNPMASVAGTFWPYIEAGQMTAMLVGAKAAAGYEILYGEPGRATSGMDAQSLGHLYLIALVVISNILFQLKKSRGRD